jgi:hypothetical protein
MYQKEMGNVFCAVNNSNIIMVMMKSTVPLLTRALSTEEVYLQYMRINMKDWIQSEKDSI